MDIIRYEPWYFPRIINKDRAWMAKWNIQLSYAYERKIKSDIKRKIRILQELELPLLIEKGFISQPAAVTSNCNIVTANCNNDTLAKNPNSSSFLQNKQALAGIWTRDLCLTKATLLDSLILRMVVLLMLFRLQIPAKAPRFLLRPFILDKL